MEWFIYPAIFIFGAAVGSFLNVVIFRLGTEEGAVRGRSHCRSCGRVLAWYDLLPMFSFVFLRGRCRYCRERISWQYPLVEAATGALFVLTFNFQPFIFNEFSIWQFSVINLFSVACLLYVICSLVVIFVYDLRHYIIPDKVLFPAIGAAACRLALGAWPSLGDLGSTLNYFSSPLFSAFGAAAFFLFLVLITRGRGMGLGDVKLVFLLGLFLGWPVIFIALFFAFFLGAALGLGLILAGKKTMKSQIPFGPFLIGGALAAYFGGQYLLPYFYFLGGF